MLKPGWLGSCATVLTLNPPYFAHAKMPKASTMKGANVLVGLDSLAKLADFGCSKRAEAGRCLAVCLAYSRVGLSGASLPVQETTFVTIEGSIPWMAPEVRCALEATISHNVHVASRTNFQLTACKMCVCKQEASISADECLQVLTHSRYGRAGRLGSEEGWPDSTLQ